MSTNQDESCSRVKKSVREWMSDSICPNVLAWHGSLTMLEIKKNNKKQQIMFGPPVVQASVMTANSLCVSFNLNDMILKK